MATQEIISLAPQDIKRIARTVFRLRQMRGSHFFEGMLNDAEELGAVAADAIVGLVQTGSPAPLVARWEEALIDGRTRLEDYYKIMTFLLFNLIIS